MNTFAQINPPSPMGGVPSGTSRKSGTRTSVIPLTMVVLSIGYLWFRLINNLRVEWSTNPQYSYGWIVPLLCVGLLIRRWHATQEGVEPLASQNHRSELRSGWVGWFIILFAFLYLPTRLIEAATPDWRPIQWAIGIEAVVLTLCAVELGAGRKWRNEMAFPVCFFLVAIPWPTLFEIPIIQGLARLNASIVVEVLGFLGTPAMQHGNVIEVSTGLVGIDDACSGIRSLQSSLMISLFLGEFYRLSRWRRILLVPASFILAFAFNAVRTSLLTWIAAKKGLAAIAQYHDEAGLTILLACTAVMWGLALLLHKAKPSNPEVSRSASEIKSIDRKHAGVIGLAVLGVSLAAWLVSVETGVELWYHVRESHIISGLKWTFAFPEDNATFKNINITPTARGLLQYDEGKQGQWKENDGTLWQAFYFTWAPGRVAGYLAKRHEPEICLPAAGQTLRSGPELTFLKIHDLEMPVRCYQFETQGGNSLYVYQCRYEAGASKEDYVDHDSARYNLVRSVWAGRGIHGQQVWEIILSGFDNAQSAKTALVLQLNNLIKIQPSALPVPNAVR